jgi:signal transduction histidine kinase
MAGVVSSTILNWAVLTVSFFNTISLFWLGLMVLLAGNRRSAGTWLTGSGLLLGALFFTSHTAIFGRGLSSTSFGMDFWWWVSWVPAAVAPLAWYSALLWYSGYRFDQPHRHHTWLTLNVLLAISILLLMVGANPLPSYQYVVGRVIVVTPGIAGIPMIVIIYVAYSLLCYLLPLDLLRLTQLGHPLEARARQRARPYLVTASVSLLLAGIVLAWTALWALNTRPVPTLSDGMTESIVQEFDLAVASLVALAITLLGRAIVGFEVFTGRPLPRNRFLRQWRSTIILAGGFGAAAAFTLSIDLRPIYSLMLATGLMTLFYALYSWRSFVEREEFMERLQPFVASQNLYGQLTTPQTGVEDSSRALFDTFCRDVLELRQAILAPAGALATLAGPPLVYPPGGALPTIDTSDWPGRFSRQVHCLPVDQSSVFSSVPAGSEAFAIDWAVPLWSSRGLDGVLFLGEKINGNPFTEEEIEIAQAAGERMLDLLAGTEMARLSMDLLRQRLAQARVLDGQGRRVLHDEVLPELHTALLHLSALAPGEITIQQAMTSLSTAHRQIADLMREMPLPVPHRLVQGGLASALRGLVEHDFSNDFHTVEWQIQPEAVEYARGLPVFVNEVLYFAARELVRNAAIHGRPSGGKIEPDAKLCLKIKLEVDHNLQLTIIDNGAGFQPGSSSSTPASGSGSGLRIHNAMLAAVGARLEVMPLPEKGTQASIVYPLTPPIASPPTK